MLDGLGLSYKDEWGAGRLTHEVYDELVEPKLMRPTFVLDHPRETSPLARVHRDDPTLVERFEVVVNGNELANAYSELNDPIDQRERFEAEARARAAGDLEAGTVDEDYLRALEFGLPPTGGMGLGIDRLVMLLAGVTSIREVILLPDAQARSLSVRPRSRVLFRRLFVTIGVVRGTRRRAAGFRPRGHVAEYVGTQVLPGAAAVADDAHLGVEDRERRAGEGRGR